MSIINKKSLRSILREGGGSEFERKLDLAFQRSKEVFFHLMDYLDDKDDELSKKAIEAISYLATMKIKYYFHEVEDKVNECVLQLLKHKRPKFRERAIDMINFLPSRRLYIEACNDSSLPDKPDLLDLAEPMLLELLEDKNNQKSAGFALSVLVNVYIMDKKEYDNALNIFSILARLKHDRIRERMASFWKQNSDKIKEHPEIVKTMIPLLKELLKDSNEQVRESAEDSLNSIRKNLSIEL